MGPRVIPPEVRTTVQEGVQVEPAICELCGGICISRIESPDGKVRCLKCFLAAMSKKLLWLDDVRTPPSVAWTWVKTSFEAIKALRSKSFDIVSLDHDLGEGAGDGYEVLKYLEAEAFRNPEFKVPEIRIHTSNSAARIRMLQAVQSIERFVAARGESVSEDPSEVRHHTIQADATSPREDD